MKYSKYPFYIHICFFCANSVTCIRHLFLPVTSDSCNFSPCRHYQQFHYFSGLSYVLVTLWIIFERPISIPITFSCHNKINWLSCAMPAVINANPKSGLSSTCSDIVTRLVAFRDKISKTCMTIFKTRSGLLYSATCFIYQH
jgi:hypothetical protein